MSLESSEVVVGSTGHLWRAAVGTAFPTNISTAVNETLWTELGYTSTEGVGFNFGRETNEVEAWQSYDPLRVISTKIPKEISAEFLQFNQNTWATAMGGGTWTGSAPNFVYEPPDESFIDEFALIVEFSDGDDDYRFCYRKVSNMSGIEFSTSRENPIMLPVTVKVLAADGGLKPFIFQTNDTNLGDATLAGS